MKQLSRVRKYIRPRNPGVKVLAHASPNGGLELAKDFWVAFLRATEPTNPA
jgi:hypothetical protein